jgi:hypothetical protein
MVGSISATSHSKKTNPKTETRMKKCIFLLVAMARLVCQAQTEIGTVFQNDMNAIFQNVDRT